MAVKQYPIDRSCPWCNEPVSPLYVKQTGECPICKKPLSLTVFTDKIDHCVLNKRGGEAMNETTVTVTANEWIRLNQLDEKLRQIKSISEMTWQNDGYRFYEILKIIGGISDDG